MKYLRNDVVSCHCMEAMIDSIERLCHLIKNNPSIIVPFRAIDENAKAIFLSAGFDLHPTVKKTTLFYDSSTDSFFKILHPLTLKNKFIFMLSDKARSIYNLSVLLNSNGLKIPEITAYGIFKNGNKPFFAMKKAEGKSLYDILIREEKTLPIDSFMKVIDKVAELHNIGYWFGDAHLSHIFITASDILSFIDIDGVRKNAPFMIRNLTKDIAGLNHPELKLSNEEKKDLINRFMEKTGVKDKDEFIRMLKHYTERRWRE